MKIVDEFGKQITDPDLSSGYLLPDRLFVMHHEAIDAVPELGHTVITEYPETGGVDIDWVVDAPAQEAVSAWDEYEDVMRYVLYSEQELAQIEIEDLKRKLNETDYIAAKTFDAVVGVDNVDQLLLTFSEALAQYKNVFAQRAEWRSRINDLEKIAIRR